MSTVYEKSPPLPINVHRERVRAANASSTLLCRIAAHETREKVVASFDATAAVLDLRVCGNINTYHPLTLMSLITGRKETIRTLYCDQARGQIDIDRGTLRRPHSSFGLNRRNVVVGRAVYAEATTRHQTW